MMATSNKELVILRRDIRHLRLLNKMMPDSIYNYHLKRGTPSLLGNNIGRRGIRFFLFLKDFLTSMELALFAVPLFLQDSCREVGL